jgi:large subunit ribosomal protein L9
MKIILFKDVENVGDANTQINVSEGYARNYLFPRRLAVLATTASVALMEKRQEKKKQEMESRRSELQAQAEKLNSITLSLSADAGEGGKLFGSITAQEIAAAASQEAGFTVEKKKIALAEPIKTLGEHKVTVKIYQDIVATLKINVIAK